MKKLLITLLTLGCLAFTSCYDAIYQGIREEVELEDAKINGYINSIVRWTEGSKEYIILQNGKLYYKQVSENGASGSFTLNASHNTWSDMPNGPKYLEYDYENAKFKGNHFYKLATSSDAIFALSYRPEYNEDHGRNVPTDIKLWYATSIGGEWKPCTAINSLISSYVASLDEDKFMMDSSIHLFSTNAPQAAHRKAYIRIGGTGAYYSNSANDKCTVIELDASQATSNNPSKLVDNASGTNTDTTPGTNTMSVVYISETPTPTVKFLPYKASCTNETVSSDATHYYYGNGKTLACYTIDGTDGSSFSATDAEILSMCITSNSIILGTDEEGAYRVMLHNDGVIETSTSNFSTNASSIMCEPYIIRMLFSVDPSQAETDQALYSSMQFRYTASNASASYSNLGLYSYFPGRGNWNRE